MKAESLFYGSMPDGREVTKYILTNDNGMSAHFISLGATLDKLFVPDTSGCFDDVLLGFDNLYGYLFDSAYQGAVVGPYANRISKGSLWINGRELTLPKNDNNKNCLHSAGEYSFSLWDGEITADNEITFTYFIEDGASYFPGNSTAKVIYTLDNSNSLIINYLAVSDKDTVFNLTNHSYFNLSGYSSGSILDHVAYINADKFIPVNEILIPTGDILPVKSTPFSFILPKEIGKDIEADHEQLKFAGGYDHNFCINDYDGTLKKAAIIYDKKSKRKLTVITDMPGIQFYTGNSLDGKKGKNGIYMDKHTGFCLETQFYPDTPNNPCFPQCNFTSNEIFKSTTIYNFSID